MNQTINSSKNKNKGKRHNYHKGKDKKVQIKRVILLNLLLTEEIAVFSSNKVILIVSSLVPLIVFNKGNGLLKWIWWRAGCSWISNSRNQEIMDQMIILRGVLTVKVSILKQLMINRKPCRCHHKGKGNHLLIFKGLILCQKGLLKWFKSHHNFKNRFFKNQDQHWWDHNLKDSRLFKDQNYKDRYCKNQSHTNQF